MLLVRAVREKNIDELAALYLDRCGFLRFGNMETVREYLKRNIASRSYLYGYLIEKEGKLVASSLVVKVSRNAGLLLFTVSEPTFTGFERMAAFEKAYRDAIGVLLEKGINCIQLSAANNADGVAYGRATGSIPFADAGGAVYFETYLHLLGTVLAKLTNTSFEKLSLLKLASIPGNPTETDGSSYTFDFQYKGNQYLLKVDKLESQIEYLSCPGFEAGFRYSAHAGFTNKPNRIFFEVSNHERQAKRLEYRVTLSDDGRNRVISAKKVLVPGGSRFRFPFSLQCATEGIKTLKVDFSIDGKRITVSKAFLIRTPYKINLNLQKSLQDQAVLEVHNLSDKPLKVQLGRNGNGLARKSVSLAAEGHDSIPLAFPNGSKNGIQRINLTARGNGTESNFKITRYSEFSFSTDGTRHICNSGSVAAAVDSHSGIISFWELNNPKCMLFQLPEELGPPFTEYEFNRFQYLPSSYQVSNPFAGPLLYGTYEGRTKPRVRLLRKEDRRKHGFSVEARLRDTPGVVVKKKVIFRNPHSIEIAPTVINTSGKDMDCRIAVRTCLKILSDTVVRAPIFEGSEPIKCRLSDNPYYVNELLLSGAKLKEKWAAYEFAESSTCAGFIWRGKPSCDFFPVWFNKLPWLMYDLKLKNGAEMVLPSHLIMFQGGNWKAVSQAAKDFAQEEA